MTKKVGSAGKFGTRYGMRLRKKWVEIDKKQRIRHECPACSRQAVHRIASGIWECKKCKARFTGGAYVPVTGIAKTIEKVIKHVLEEGEIEGGSSQEL